MHAITAAAFGPPGVLVPTELPTPEPGPGQVLVEVTGAGVGPWDSKIRRGLLGPQPFPYVPGGEVSGLVVALGDGAAPFGDGDAVFGRTGGYTGGYAEYAVADASEFAAAPAGRDLAAAGGVPIAAVTALEGLDDHLHVEAGQRLLVAGAAGGVGTFVVQLAKARGASVVATASPDHHAYLRDLGADEVLDYHDDWVPAATGVDAAFDAVGGDTLRQAVQAVRAGGRAVTIASGDVERHGDVRVSSFQVSNSRARLAEVAALIDAGQVRVEISARLPLDEAAHAHELVEAGHTRGKILLLPG